MKIGEDRGGRIKHDACACRWPSVKAKGQLWTDDEQPSIDAVVRERRRKEWRHWHKAPDL
jgi:hypothetical protein